MSEIKNGDKVKLLGYGACPNWKLYLIGHEAKVIKTSYPERVLATETTNPPTRSDVHWPLSAMEKI